MRDLLASLDGLRERLREIPQADAQRLQDLRTEILGRKQGALTDILKALPTLDAPTREAVGGAANTLKREFEAALAAREQALAAAGQVVADLDPTMPGRAAWQGGLHLVTQVIEEICDIFRELGFTRAVGPEIETERNNFYALNFPHDHPALDSQDSFYVTNDLLLRTHTSPVQIRTMEAYRPPIRVVIPGQVYRRDPFDASHAPGVRADRGPGGRRGDLVRGPQGDAQPFRPPVLRRGHGRPLPPLVLPVHRAVGRHERAMHGLRRRAAARPASNRGWMEILGSGMVHPAVLENCGIDAERYTGFAFGMGPHRIAMLRYGIPDIRLFYESDMRFLTQFAGQLPGHPMNLSRRWLEALLGRPLDAEQVVALLTARCSPVEGLEPLHGDLGDVLVARVLDVKPHPNADRLRLCLVDAGGSGGPLEVVCGAPNVTAGKIYPVRTRRRDAAGWCAARAPQDPRHRVERDALLGAGAGPGAGSGRDPRAARPGRRRAPGSSRPCRSTTTASCSRCTPTARTSCVTRASHASSAPRWARR